MDSINIPPRILAGDFAGWLRDRMSSRRVSARMLALRTGLDHTTIYRLALGERQPTLATAVSLLRILGDGPEELPATNGIDRLRAMDLSLL